MLRTVNKFRKTFLILRACARVLFNVSVLSLSLSAIIVPNLTELCVSRGKYGLNMCKKSFKMTIPVLMLYGGKCKKGF